MREHSPLCSQVPGFDPNPAKLFPCNVGTPQLFGRQLAAHSLQDDWRQVGVELGGCCSAALGGVHAGGGVARLSCCPPVDPTAGVAQRAAVPGAGDLDCESGTL